MILAKGANRWQKMKRSSKFVIAMRTVVVEVKLIFINIKWNVTIGNNTKWIKALNLGVWLLIRDERILR